MREQTEIAEYPADIQSTLDDIDAVEKCFELTSGKCVDADLARERLGDLKSRLQAKLRQARGSYTEKALREASCRLKSRTNSRPTLKWLSELEDARYKLKRFC
jgi:hypothetical protein